jgi:hypothetical protein
VRAALMKFQARLNLFGTQRSFGEFGEDSELNGREEDLRCYKAKSDLLNSIRLRWYVHRWVFQNFNGLLCCCRGDQRNRLSPALAWQTASLSSKTWRGAR